MNIKAVIQKAKLNNDFLNFVNDAKENVSFLGQRYVVVLGFSGVAHIDILAYKIINLVQQHNFEYSEQQRNVGKQIARKINTIYEKNDIRFKKCNILTKLFCFLRSLPELVLNSPKYPYRTISLTRWIWSQKEDSCVSSYEDGFNMIFSYYTKRQYEEEFGKLFSARVFNNKFPRQKEPLWTYQDSD